MKMDSLCTVRKIEISKREAEAELEVVALNFKGLPVLEVIIHNFENWVWKAHAQERKRRFWRYGHESGPV